MKNFRYFFLIFLLSVAIFLSGTTVLAEGVFDLESSANPLVRVLLAKTNASAVFSASSTISVSAGAVEYLTLAPSATITLKYAGGRYEVKSGETFFATRDFIRLVPAAGGVITVASLKRPLSGHGSRSYNQYRGTIEYRYSPKNKTPYIINELPLEDYLAGLTETAQSDPAEYVKAVVVAARSYAYVNIGPRPPTAKNLFDLYATTQDQLYLGYESEQRLPGVIAAALDTFGEMVMYQDRPALALYFGQSRGQTKTWPSTQRPRPWLKSVKTKYDSPRRASGHGYGMSMHDARERARRDLWSYTDILTYYYASTTIERMY